MPYADVVPAALLKELHVGTPAPAKPAVVKPPPSLAEVLHGVERTKVATSGVTVVGELKRLWDGDKSAADTPCQAPKCMIFDPKQASFICVPTPFLQKKRYRDDMNFFAMALTSNPLQLLQTRDMDDYSSRRLFADTEKATMLNVKELEVQWGSRSNVGGSNKANAGMNNVGIRFTKLKKKMESMKKSDVEIANIIARLTVEREDGLQSTMINFFSGK